MTGWRKRQIGEHMTKDEALKLALEALESAQSYIETEHDDRKSLYEPYGMDYKYSTEAEDLHKNKEAITAIKEALAQPAPVQEPVAWICKRDDGHFDVLTDSTCKQCFPVYTTPPQRTWVGLTPEETDDIIANAIDKVDALIQTADKLKGKNT